MTQSMVAWRMHFGKGKFSTFKVRYGEFGVCEFCDGDEEIETIQFGRIRCICAVKDREKKLNIAHHPYRSSFKRVDIAKIKPWGTAKSQESIQKLLIAAHDFEQSPTTWLTIAGKPGTGKSHVLQWLAQEFGPWALYMTDTEFNNLIFDRLEEEDLNTFLRVMKYAPILLYDDLGAGYNANFPIAQLRSVFDFRYKMPQEYVTAVTTNLDAASLQALDFRIADRVRDVDLVTKVALDGVESWRTRK